MVDDANKLPLDDDAKKLPHGFTFADGILSGSLKHGFKTKDGLQKDFEMGQLDVGDMLDAEVDATGELSFRVNLMVRQLKRVGSFNGPFSVGMIRKLRPSDFSMLRDAQNQVQILGEDGAAPDAAD